MEISPAKQHVIFQTYLTKEKSEVVKNLKKKIIPSTDFEDYEILKTLGEGSYGVVFAAKNIHNNKTFALKVISKQNLARENQLKHLISEIRILNAIKFEFLISLECYFTNRCNVFMVMPYIDGIHFLKLLRKVKKLDEDSARFFVGQVILGIEYLHHMGIVYRDLKPENLLLGLDGYIKLVDYGFSKVIDHKHTYTFCGTPEYIAPEILLNNGYHQSPDWWAVGVLLFEMCNGSPPFTGKNELKLYEKILVGDIIWPVHFSLILKSLLQGLLQVDKTKRLGCMKNKSEGIKLHRWFASLDWIALWHKKILPPISIPVVKNEKTDKVKYSFKKCQSMIYSESIRNLDNAI